MSYELGSGTMLDGLDEALEGLSAGEETSFNSKLQGGEHEGEEALVKVKVNSVKTEELPELDDDFAQDASEFDTLDELKADVRKAAERDAEGRQATEARDAFIAKLEEGAEIPVPKGVKADMLEQQLKNVTADPSKATDEQKADAEKQVVKELTDQMVLDALAEKLDVKVSQADVTNFLAPSPSSTAWIRPRSSRPSSRTASSAPPCRKLAAPRACSPACAPSPSSPKARPST